MENPTGRPVLSDRDSSGVVFPRVAFSDANLIGAVFLGTELTFSDLRGADAGGASFFGVKSAGARLRRHNLASAQFEDADLPNPNLLSSASHLRFTCDLHSASVRDRSCMSVIHTGGRTNFVARPPAFVPSINCFDLKKSRND